MNDTIELLQRHQSIRKFKQTPITVKQIEAINIPELVYPVFGMCVGVPDQNPGIRPRLGTRAIYHSNQYDKGKFKEEIEKYDEITHEYYFKRTKGKRDTVWSKEMADKYRQPFRTHMRKFLEDQQIRFE